MKIKRVEHVAIAVRNMTDVMRMFQDTFGLALESWGGARVMRVRYEDLVQDPKKTVRAIADFCDLAYEPAMLKSMSSNG